MEIFQFSWINKLLKFYYQYFIALIILIVLFIGTWFLNKSPSNKNEYAIIKKTKLDPQLLAVISAAVENYEAEKNIKKKKSIHNFNTPLWAYIERKERNDV